jgi:acid phosphatase type 7
MRLRSDAQQRNRRSPAPVAILYLLALLLLLTGCGAGVQRKSSAATLNAATQPQSATGTPIPADQVVVAAGDIACDPTSASYHNGLGDPTHCQMKATSDLVASIHPNDVLVLGDNQYEAGNLKKYQQSYGPTWGRFKDITYPIPGNHDYETTNAAGYFAYFGTAAGDPTKGYYSFDIGAWHVVALNSQCKRIGGCQAGSPEEQWLKADLASHPAMCTLAMWHMPEFDSGDYPSTAFLAFWTDLYNAGADVILNGHSHLYERFAPQTPNGALDTTHGIRQFTAGTGGDDHSSINKIKPNSQARNATDFGVLKLTLHASSYDWQFIPIAGEAFTDSGSAGCHDAP